MKPITIEVLRKLNPTPENPVELVCFDGYFVNHLKEVSVIAIGVNIVLIFDGDSNEDSIWATWLPHYTLKPKKVKRWVNLYEYCKGGVVSHYYTSKEKADEAASATEAARIACVEIEVDEGVL